MAKWIYTVNGGIKLRELIDDADGSNRDAKKVLAQLKECIDELIGKLDTNDEELYGTDLEELKDEIDIATGSYYATSEDDDDDIDYSDDNEYNPDDDDDYMQDDANSILESFYDICDSVRAWVGM